MKIKDIAIALLVASQLLLVACSNNTERNTATTNIVESGTSIKNIPANSVLSNDYIFKHSNTAKITYDELMSIDQGKYDLARNEIFARKGYEFNNERYKNYFSSKSWYKPQQGIDPNNLSDVEKYNVAFIQFFENRMNISAEDNTKEKKDLLRFKADQDIKADINGDGKDEVIRFNSTHNEFTLTINNASIKGEGINIYDEFAIIDIDKSDSIKEIIISESGPSDDYKSKYFYFDGKNIVKMGETEGDFDYGVKPDGAGKLTSMKRAKVLQTWSFNETYKLSPKHMLEKIPQEIYKTDYDVFVIKPISVYDSNNIKSSKWVVQDGQSIKIIGTDNEKWCLIETSSGKRGWFSVRNFSILTETGEDAREAFLGLCYAD